MNKPPVRLSQLRFGQIDARNEVTTRDPIAIEHFRQSFLEPSGIRIDDFKKGVRYFVYGMKGSGKTAFLRYLSMTLDEEHCLTKFISFATQISDQQRTKLVQDAGITAYEQGTEADEDVGQSAVNVWLLFIFKQIANFIDENQTAFTRNKEIDTFCDLVKRFHEGETKGLLNWLAGMAKRGRYSLKSRHFDAKVQGKAADMDKEFTTDQIVEQCFNLLAKLFYEGTQGAYIFFDELNLSFGSRSQHRRDAILIRDLILAIDRVNGFFTDQRINIFILAAARSEVLHALNVPTLEINKVLSDKGAELRWFGQTASETWPITRLIERKIQASESLLKRKPSPDVFEQYFQRGIFNMAPQVLMVELTWCNPRDVVLLLGKAAEASEGELRFGEAVINRVLEKFSEDAWNERVEELNVKYAKVEIDSVKRILLSFQPWFKAADFTRQAKTKEADPNIKKLMKGKTAERILEDLYRIGVIGQSSREPDLSSGGLRQLREHWAYRGDLNFDPTAWMIVHRGLWPQLRLGRIQPNPATLKPMEPRRSRIPQHPSGDAKG
ncbi:hypothetical protein J6524_11425 [Bradyrhizobium sp. WSM 1738]|uniref:P-loop ATPase, Sll1717 family n=1 Tax=Bradyrhizobium hereditatis TaxID=2821405 RepID=UPI001CE25574|nr:hypothetical protein [Bradyrhizobium hereditatis]MCA6115498.1 hypothetical protein [Bradyrhizobium hereditatis]